MKLGGASSHKALRSEVLGSASQVQSDIVDRASPLDIGGDRHGSGHLEVRSTEEVASRHALTYWRDGVLRRMEALGGAPEAHSFRGRLMHVSGHGADFVEHATDTISARRDQPRLKRDGCDDVSISLLASGRSATLVHAGIHHMRAGDIYVIDYSQPMEIVRPQHRDISLICSRQRIVEALGHDPSKLAGRRLPRRGIGALLRSHLQAMAVEAMRLTPEQRAAALSSAVEMSLAALQAEFGEINYESLPNGLYQAARIVIHRNCGDPDFDSDALVTALGCSRATLYRLFAARGESVAATIWSTRIECAHAMLTSPVQQNLRVGEVAQRCGFADQPTFNRMFKRRYGMTPLDAARTAAACEFLPPGVPSGS